MQRQMGKKVIYLVVLLIVASFLLFLQRKKQKIVLLHSRGGPNVETSQDNHQCSVKQSVRKDHVDRVTALASFPRSGNSFLRYQVESCTQYTTSSMYCDKYLRKTFKSECDKTDKFLVKTHYPVTSLKRYPDPQTHWQGFDQFIHLVRNPFDSIVSYHHWHRNVQNHTKKVQEVESFRDSLRMGKLQWYVDKYRSHYLYWKSVPLPSILVKYEELRSNQLLEMQRVIEMLLPSEYLDDTEYYIGLIQCAINDKGSPYTSKTQSNDNYYGLAWLSDEHITLIKDQLGSILCELGYAGDVQLDCLQYNALVDFQHRIDELIQRDNNIQK